MNSSFIYDLGKYAELLLRAIATILQPAGLDQEKIEHRLAHPQAQPLSWQIPLEWFTQVKQRDFAKVG
jgi:hypothetical protein